MNIHKTGEDITVRAEISLRRSEPLEGTILEFRAHVAGHGETPDPAYMLQRQLVLDQCDVLMKGDAGIEYDAEEMARDIGVAIFKKRILEAMKQCRK